LPFDWLFDTRQLRVLVVAQVRDDQNPELAAVAHLSHKRPRIRSAVEQVRDGQTDRVLVVA